VKTSIKGTSALMKGKYIMLNGQRIAILVEDGFEDSELTVPLKDMKSAGARVIVVGTDLVRSYRSKSDKRTIIAEVTADMVKVENLDAIIIPGGYAPDRMRLYQPMIDLVKKAYAAGKVVAAICHGPQLLISADIVRGRRMTSWSSIAVDLRNAGADWVDEPVVQDGNIITSRKLADLPIFDKAIIDAVAANSQSSENNIPFR
jgi:protease I